MQQGCVSHEATNVAYGGPNPRTLFVTDADGYVLTARLPVPGHVLVSHQ
jgi:gluconolactonase